MNSIVSNTETLQSDDINGVNSLYGAAASASSPVVGKVSLLRSKAHALSTAARCREAAEPSAGRQRLQGRSPAASAAAVVSKKRVFFRSGSRDVQLGRQ